MSSHDQNIYFLKQDKKSKRFFVTIPDQDFQKADKCEKSEKSHHADNEECDNHCTSVAVLDTIVTVLGGSTGITGVVVPGLPLSAAIVAGLTGITPTCAIADIQKLEGGKSCGYYDINVGHAYGGSTGQLQGGCTAFGAPTSYFVFGQSALSSVGGTVTVGGVFGLPGVVGSTTLVGFPITTDGGTVAVPLPTINFTTNLLTPLGYTGLINSCFPCAVEKNTVIQDKGQVLASVSGSANYVFTFSPSVAYQVSFPFENVVVNPVINEFPPALGATVAVDLRAGLLADVQARYAAGLLPTTYQIEQLLLLSGLTGTNFTNFAGELAVEAPALIAFVGLTFDKVEFYVDVKVSVNKRRNRFRACLGNANPGSLAGLRIYTNASLDELKCAEAKVALTNLATRQVRVLSGKQLGYSKQCHNSIPGAESAIILQPRDSIPSGTYGLCLIVDCRVYELGNVVLTANCLLDVSSSSDSCSSSSSDSCSDSSSSTDCSDSSSSTTKCSSSSSTKCSTKSSSTSC